MTKGEFLSRLTAALSGMPQEDVKKTIDYYSEIIDDAVEDGDDEQTVVERFGDIDEIADKIMNETPVQKLKKKFGAPVIALLIIGSPLWFAIAVAAAAVVLALYMVVWVMIVSLFAVFAALALPGACLLVVSVPLLLVRPIDAMLTFGTALACAGLAVFMFYLSVWCAKMVIKFTRWVFAKRGWNK